MKRILKLNEISPVADKIFANGYEYSKNVENPTGIILRSYKMHDYPLNEKLLGVARAGAGVNNIPIEKCTGKGIVVFNTPGANANAVKELVIMALLMSSRKINEAMDWVQSVKGEADVAKLAEKNKNKFVGPEIYGKKLAVIGLGAIGAMVANSAVDLGMEVYGYDPYISVDSAWRLSRAVHHVTNFDELVTNCDYITLHVPLTSTNKDLIDASAISRMKNGVRIINCARGGLVNNEDVVNGIASGKVERYFTDFIDDSLLGNPKVIAIPHLGASTPEAEDNCAMNAARELRDYIENGNIVNSVNFPRVFQARQGTMRLTFIHKNIKNTLSLITTILAENEINIENLINNNNGNYAYTIVDVDNEVSKDTIDKFKKIEGIIRVRAIQ